MVTLRERSSLDLAKRLTSVACPPSIWKTRRYYGTLPSLSQTKPLSCDHGKGHRVPCTSISLIQDYQNKLTALL